jgi:hypothetical protein
MTAIDEREQLARIDLALAQIDLALADAAKRREELRQMTPAEPWKFIITAMVTFMTALGAWSAFLVFLLTHWWK